MSAAAEAVQEQANRAAGPQRELVLLERRAEAQRAPPRPGHDHHHELLGGEPGILQAKAPGVGLALKELADAGHAGAQYPKSLPG